MRMLSLLPFVLCLLVAFSFVPGGEVRAAPDGASKVTGWRTDGSGRYPEAEPPTSWSSRTNVVWRKDLGGWSNATPVVTEKSIFVNVEPFKLVCLDRATTEIRWEADHAYPAVGHEGELPGCHDVTGYSSPTPTTDGTNVYCLYGNGVAASHTVDGKRRWIRLVEKPSRNWGQSASPVLVEDKLIISINKVTALDAATGKTVWEIESAPSWGSPVATRIGDVAVIVTCAGQIVRVQDGKILADKLASLEFNAPIVHEGKVYFMSENARAYRLPGELPGDGKLELEPLWTARLKRERYYSSPLLHDGKIYAITRSRILTILDAATGEEVEELRMGRRGSEMYSSPTLAGELVFISGEDGRTLVIQPGESIEILSQNKLGNIRSCPVFVKDRLFVRSGNFLYCIAESGEEG